MDDRKRPRTSNDEDENAEDLLQLLDGDGFVTKESKEEEEANRRRARRRQRLAQLEKELSATEEKITNESVNVSAIKQEVVKMEELKPPAEIKHGDSGDQNRELEKEKEDDDEFDMFSSSVSPVVTKKGTSENGVPAHSIQPSSSTKTTRGHEQRDWDDAEGYYKAVIGESIEIQGNARSEDNSSQVQQSSIINFKVSGLVGKGVFSTVLKCTTISNDSSIQVPPTVAMKCVRHNETMAKAATHEIQFLQQLNGSRGIVPLLLPIVGGPPVEYRGHVLLVFPYLEYNLRDVLQKFGKGVGLALQAVKSYFGQLFAAATHLKKHQIIHADIKPDNILVSGDFSSVQLADFGSAFESSAPENQPTPYLVSRFYRAPEIILGLVPTIAVDLWSLAVTVAEVFLGEVLFRGKSNNDMLYVFQQYMGPFSNRVIRQHMVQSQKMPNAIPRHFRQEGTNFCFAQQTIDPISGEPVHKVLSLTNNNSNKPKFPSATPLHQKILKAKSATDSKASVLHFSDLLQKCLVLDPTRRIALKDALQHPFFQAEKH